MEQISFRKTINEKPKSRSTPLVRTLSFMKSIKGHLLKKTRTRVLFENSTQKQHFQFIVIHTIVYVLQEANEFYRHKILIFERSIYSSR